MSTEHLIADHDLSFSKYRSWPGSIMVHVNKEYAEGDFLYNPDLKDCCVVRLIECRLAAHYSPERVEYTWWAEFAGVPPTTKENE